MDSTVEMQVFKDITGVIDPVTAFWVNYEPGVGSVTLTCWGSAWTCYFGGMMGRTIQKFFAGADTDYLVNKLGITPHLKGRKRDNDYLGRIIDVVKLGLETEVK